MKDLLIKLWSLILPPLDQRKGSPLAFLGMLISSTTIVLSIFIRIKYPNFAFRWKVLILISCFLLVIHNNLARYTRIPWHDTGKDEMMGYHVVFDIIAGGGVFGILANVIDYLFLATEEDLNVRGANEYRKYLVEKYPNLNVTQLNTLENELCQGGTFERPLYFPGTKNYYIRDLADAVRGLGYHKGIHQKGLARYEGGYSALIGAEKLEAGDPEIAQAIKQVTLFRTLKTFIACFLSLDFCQWLLCNQKIFNPATHDNLISLQESFENTILPKCLSRYFVIGLFGCVIVARMQAFSAFCYVFAIIFTKPTQMPITIGRWEPLLFAQPHLSTSMSDMWGKHWHGLIRRPVTVLCMRPCKALSKQFAFPGHLGRAVGVFLSFLYSGLMHEACMEAMLPHIRHLKRFKSTDSTIVRKMGYGWGAGNHASTRFFVYCGLIIVLEDIWCSIIEPKLATLVYEKPKQQLIFGKTRNVLGWIWCMTCMVIVAEDLVEVWCRHGMMQIANSTFIFRFIPHF